MSTDRQISRTARDPRHSRHTEGHAQAQAEHPQVHPPSGLALEHLGTRPQAAGAGSSAAPAHLAPTARPQAPRVCVPVRACPPVRAATCGRRGAHCARGCPAGAARGGGERLPWCAERGRILMGRPPALPPCPPGSFLPLLRFLRSHPGLWPRPATPPLKGPEPRGAVRRPGSLDPRVLDYPGEGPGRCEAARGRSEGLGLCRGCPAWARAPNGHGSWERRCCLGMGVAILGGWEIKGELNPFVAREPINLSSPGLAGGGGTRTLDQS